MESLTKKIGDGCSAFGLPRNVGTTIPLSLFVMYVLIVVSIIGMPRRWPNGKVFFKEGPKRMTVDEVKARATEAKLRPVGFKSMLRNTVFRCRETVLLL